MFFTGFFGVRRPGNAAFGRGRSRFAGQGAVRANLLDPPPPPKGLSGPEPYKALEGIMVRVQVSPRHRQVKVVPTVH